MRKRKSKIHFIKERKCVQSSQEKWKCVRKDKTVSGRNGKLSKKDESLSNWKNQKNAIEWEPIKFKKNL